MFIYIKLVFLYSFLFVIPISAYFMIFYFLRSYPTVYVYFTFIFFLVFFFFSLFVYYFIVHFLAKFLLQFILSYQRIQIIFVLQIYLEATISSYYNFFFNFIVFYLLVMILPLFLMCIIFFNVKDLRFLYKRQMRKKLYIFFGIVFLLLAPPDF
jgi:hypothetical protein